MIGVVGQPAAAELLAQEGQESISDKIFLIPNGTFFYELLLFIVVFFLFTKFIVPPIQKAIADREERRKQAQRDKEEADERYAQAQREHQEHLHEARSSAASIRDEARASARGTSEELRADAERQVAEARERGERELAEQRSRVQSNLQGELPDLAGTLAQRILGRPLHDDASVRATSEQYVSSLRGSEPASASTGSSGSEGT